MTENHILTCFEVIKTFMNKKDLIVNFCTVFEGIHAKIRSFTFICARFLAKNP